MALCRGLSSGTLYQRFFSFRRLLPEEAHAFANVDYGQRMAVVAEVDDGHEPDWSEWPGTALPKKGQPTSARRGGRLAGTRLGTLLLEEILHAGEQRGNHQFSADVLTDNRRALRLLARHTAITRRTVAGGVTAFCSVAVRTPSSRLQTHGGS